MGLPTVSQPLWHAFVVEINVLLVEYPSFSPGPSITSPHLSKENTPLEYARKHMGHLGGNTEQEGTAPGSQGFHSTWGDGKGKIQLK